MKFENRTPSNKKINFLDGNKESRTAEIIDFGTGGTPLNAENLNKGNWRDDTSLEFSTLSGNSLPNKKSKTTAIVTTSDGKTYIIPPSEINDPAYLIGNAAVTTQGTVFRKLIFDSGNMSNGSATGNLNSEFGSTIGTTAGKNYQLDVLSGRFRIRALRTSTPTYDQYGNGMSYYFTSTTSLGGTVWSYILPGTYTMLFGLWANWDQNITIMGQARGSAGHSGMFYRYTAPLVESSDGEFPNQVTFVSGEANSQFKIYEII